MNFLLIPARNDLPLYRFKITLSTVIYTVRFHFNTRRSRWMMDILDAAGNPLQCGIPVLVNRDVFGQYTGIGLPAGTIFSTDDTNGDTQPDRYAFGTTHTLFYADPA